jgi:hypothetical protein
MRRIDELHLEHPFAGSRMLRDMLACEALRGLFMSLKGGGISTMRTALPHEERARVAALCAVLPQRGTLKNSAVSWGAWVMSSISSRPLGVQEAHGLAESSHRSALHHVLRALVCR